MKTALVVVDMLNDFVDGALANSAAKPIIGNVADLIQFARDQDDWIVIYANDAHQDSDLEFEVFGEHAVVGSAGAEVIAELAPQDGDVVLAKRYYSAFTATDLDATCRVHDIQQMIVVGQHTNCCCRHTTYDAFTRGIAVGVVEDATCVFEPMVGDQYDSVQAEAISYLETFYNSKVHKTADLVAG